MFTDGVASHWAPGEVRATDSAEAAARTLLTRYNRLSDDATVLVLKPCQG